MYAGAVVLLLLSVVTISEAREHDEAVLNPSAQDHLSDWRVGCEDGALSLGRAEIDDGPEGRTTAVELRHPGGDRDWCMAMVGLRDPEDFFHVGRTYRLRAYVRDLDASGRSAGILLANDNFAERPTEETKYEGFTDDSWHLLQRTFVATSPAGPDTALYVDLPVEGPLHWQITSASVQEVELPEPAVLWGDSSPSLRMTFDGPEGSRPDGDVWTYEVGGHGWGNDEVQSYTDRTSNAALDGRGSLVLTAREEAVTGPDGIERQHSSARLSTVGKFAIPPGSYVEATLRAPADKGVRPAFWLIGADFEEVGWPACGELDVMEGTQRSRSMVRQTIHFPRAHDLDTDAPYGEAAPGGYTTLDSPRDGAFHRYGVYFDDEVVQFYVDGEPTLGLTRTQAEERGRTWPFGQPQTAVLNVALGPDLTEVDFPVSMAVAEIAVWRGGVPPTPDVRVD
ncbi:glycoside hydrolase family 16 protein [Geodermatophilus sp. SYSU D01036]